MDAVTAEIASFDNFAGYRARARAQARPGASTSTQNGDPTRI